MKYDDILIQNDSSLIISGSAMTADRDRHLESICISPRAFQKGSREFLSGSTPLLVDHGFENKYGSNVIGKVISLDYEPKDYNIDSPDRLDMKLKALAVVTDLMVIQDVLSGLYDAFSLRWLINSWLVNGKTNQRIDTDIEIVELSITGDPANLNTTFEVVTDDKLIEQYQREEMFGQKVSIKSMYRSAAGEYFADLEFDTLESMKSMNKVKMPSLHIPQFQVKRRNGIDISNMRIK